MLKPDDSSLVARCIRRDRLSWNKLVEHYSGLVFWAIKDTLTNGGYPYKQQDIEDIFQDVFVLLWEKGKLKQVKNRQNISLWLTMVAANCAHNYFRNKRKELSNNAILQETATVEGEANSGLNQERLSQAMEKVLGLLSAREIIILKLNYFYKKTHQEIGQILRMPTNTISSIAKRTKEQLRRSLAEEGLKNC